MITCSKCGKKSCVHTKSDFSGMDFMIQCTIEKCKHKIYTNVKKQNILNPQTIRLFRDKDGNCKSEGIK